MLTNHRSVVGGVVLVFSLGILVAVGVRVRRATKYARREEMMAVALLALQNEAEDSGGRIPAVVYRDCFGKPLSSWRFRVLRWLHGERSEGFDFCWLDSTYYQIYCAPMQYYCFDDKTQLQTNVVAVTGPGTAFSAKDVSWTDLDYDTILLVEIADSGIHWMEPGDLDIRHITSELTAGLDGAGVHVGFADGEVWLLDAAVPIDRLREFFTVEGAKRSDRADVLGKYCTQRYSLRGNTYVGH